MVNTIALTPAEEDKVAQLMSGTYEEYGTCEFCGQPLNEDGECRSACDERRPPLPDYIRERPDLWAVPGGQCGHGLTETMCPYSHEQYCWHGVPESECPHYHP